jgi:hypothetical protein
LFFLQGFKMNGEWNEIDGTCVVRNVHSTESTHLEMRDLKADTYYRIELKAHNAIGYSAPASLQMKTARGEFNGSNDLIYHAGFNSGAAHTNVPLLSCVVLLCSSVAFLVR